MSNFRKTLPLLPFLILLSVLACFQSGPAHAAIPGVTFSTTVINFGTIPSHEQPTQLLTVFYDRPVFTPSHLPSLQIEGPSGPKIMLFSRSVEPSTITLIYRVKMLDDGQYGPFQYHLVLVKDGTAQAGDAASKYVLDSGVSVQGKIVQGLEGSSEAIDFGTVRYGKSAVKEFNLGFYHSNFVSASEFIDRRPKPGVWDMTRSLLSMTVTSTSPYFAGIKKGEFGLDASAWEIWKIVLRPNAPQKKLEATLTFQTGDGYFLIVPVTADLSGPGYPIPRWEPRKLREH